LNTEKERYGATPTSEFFEVSLNCIAEQLGSEYLASKKAKTELRVITKEISDLREKLAELEARKAQLEREIKT
jgi:cell division protein FtsB